MLPEITKIQDRIKEIDKVGDGEGLIDARLKYREALVRQRRIGLKKTTRIYRCRRKEIKTSLTVGRRNHLKR